MAITYVNKSAFASGTAGLTVGAVANVVADDLILLFVESANQAITTPSGFTQVTSSPVSTGTAAAAGGVRLTVFYQWATGADTTTTVADSGDHTTAIKLAYRGVDLTTPFDATPTTAIKTPASTSSSFPGITTATANACIVHASALDLDSASTATTGTPTNANLTGLTERHDQTVTAGAGGGLVIIEGFKATAGATGNTTATVTSTIQVYLTMALREAPLPERTGDLAATETGSDTFSSNGDVFVKGSLAVTETGTDTFTASGTVRDPAITGTFAVSETGADTFSATAKLVVQGDSNLTETGQDTFSGSGDVIVQGTLAATETASDIFVATGGAEVAGILSVTETGDDTLSATGDVFVVGSFSASEAGDDLFAGSGFVIIQGNLTASEAGLDTFEAVQGEIARQGNLAATEASDYFGLYVAPGYVEDGYFDIGVTGTLGRIGGMAAVESGGGTAFGTNAVMKYYNGTAWITLLKDPTVYT